MNHQEKDRAKAIIVEIIRQAGGTFQKKTNLFKAFWQSHVAYAREHHKDLSNWPIVRMPNGPGIDRFEILLGELMTEGAVEIEEVDFGNNRIGLRFHALPEFSVDLEPEAVEAIKAGVQYVDGELAVSVSEKSHVESRAWNAARDGHELDVTLDAIPEDEYQAMKKKFQSRRETFKNAIASAKR